ncbi:TolC family protein [Methylomonas sp. MK1]|uniref:TolC family protein n=1 Tax=Methylomonas sp. MK1 TaxID=1131552 RepID=UPI000371965D|nr:TolC family protein [Methylomonas sp. MK1]
MNSLKQELVMAKYLSILVYRSVPSLLAVAIGAVLLNGCSLAPAPLTQQERQSQIGSDQVKLFQQQEPVTGPLSLYQAMSRALKYNLDHRVKMMERAVAEGQATLARFDLLPDVVASAGYRSRDNFNASNSRSISTGRQSLETSTSQDRSRFMGDLSLRWNILDFGVSYFRAQQEGNKALVTAESRRKVSHNLMKDVRSAYWRALSAQRMTTRIQPVLAEAQHALALAEQAEAEKLRSPLDALRYRKSLLEIVRRLEGLLEQQQMAKSELAGLINLPPNQDFKLADDSVNPWPQVVKPQLGIDKMGDLALQLRPELRQEMYQTRIGSAEVKKAMLRLLPGVEVQLGGNYDSNSYLLNQSWGEIGTQISKNLFELLSAPQAIATAETQESLAHSRRLAAHMAILTQVHLAQQQLALADKQYQRSSELDDVNQKIHHHVLNSELTEAMSSVERIRVSVDSVLSELQRRQAYAESQDALGKLYVSLGFDPLPATMADDSVDTLANAIEAIDQEWNQGHYPVQATDDPQPENTSEAATGAGKS